MRHKYGWRGSTTESGAYGRPWHLAGTVAASGAATYDGPTGTFGQEPHAHWRSSVAGISLPASSEPLAGASVQAVSGVLEHPMLVANDNELGTAMTAVAAAPMTPNANTPAFDGGVASYFLAATANALGELKASTTIDGLKLAVKFKGDTGADNEIYIWFNADLPVNSGGSARVSHLLVWGCPFFSAHWVSVT